MDIKVWEFKRVIASHVIIGTVALFIIFNIFLISNNRHIKDELLVVNKLADKFGHEINKDMIRSLENYYNNKLKEFNKITYDKTQNTYENVISFMDDFHFKYTDEQRGLYIDKEIDFINELIIIENYNYAIKDIDIAYESVNIMNQAEAQIRMYKLSGEVAETVRKQYKNIEQRFNQLIKNKEHKNLFFDGGIYEMHSLLFKTVFGWIILEVTILIVLITAYITSYEFENNTKDIVYSTHRGRKLAVDKLVVSIVCSIIVITIILGITLITYFNTFSYTGLWNVPISNYFNWENRFPYISWWNMSFIQYLFSCIALVYIFELFFTTITFIISILIKNSYIVFFVFSILFGIAILIPSIIPTDNNLIFIAHMTPYTLVLNPFLWFMGRGAFTTFKYYEITTVLVWMGLLLIIGKLCIKMFKKQNI